MKLDQIDIDCWNNIPIGVFAVDVNMNIILFNSFAEKITGFSKDEAVSCKCFEIFRAKRCFVDRRRSWRGRRADIKIQGY